MFDKERKSEWFRENVGGHVRGGYPICTESTIVNMVADEMMTDVYVFGSGSNCGVVGKRTCTLIVGKERKRTGNRE